ncbi:nitrate- and nitrite sensing domain-containing protein [Actinoplanes subglobosus]|uniref:histidine kinase n=1 Tax=Actinoplanes subglobosus TaxID=1547892 RepID=A0ABV8JEN7_9ACTN
MRSRNWSIRSKIIAMVAVPLSALLAIWIFATVVTAGPAFTLLNARDAVQKLGDPGMRLIAQLQRERHFSAIYQATTRPAKTELGRERDTTDQIVAEFRSAAADAEMTEDLRVEVDEFLIKIDELVPLRQEVDERRTSFLYLAQKYDSIIELAFDVSRTAAVFFHERVDREVRGVIATFRGLEYLSRIDALLAGANAGGRIDNKTRETLIEYIGVERYLLRAGVADLPESSQDDYARLVIHPTFIDLDILQNKLLAQNYAGGAPPVSGTEWQHAYDYAAQELRLFGERTISQVSKDATPFAVDILGKLGLAALLGLIALGASVYVSVRLGRSLVGRLIRLRRDAIELASERLPSVVRRLQRGEMVDVDAETPPLEYGQDEIGQLGGAFTEVQRTAVQSAVDEANVRRGINEVFLNIARRSQTLLHRQLSLLDKMERRETDPRELEDLYRVDHLATRMRRHAEDLVILAGAAPGRGWRNPVPVIDVVRGAISEVEDYKRVDIRTIAASSLVGRSVGDVIHLLAELIENAASYSPPHTRVQVTGQALPNGYAVEIEDRGLGMAPDAIVEANRRLVEPPDFDPADSARLGLFVVAQLAQRHNIKVSLRASAYGGITAVVLVPGELVAGFGGRAETPSEPSGDPLGALQWPSSGELQQISPPGRRTAPDDVLPPAAPVEAPALNGQHRTAPEITGPAPSTVATELSAEGLVQRRRTRKPTLPTVNGSAEVDKTIDLSVLDELAAGLPVAPRAVPRNSVPAAEPEAAEVTQVIPLREVSPQEISPQEVSPQEIEAKPADERVVGETTGEIIGEDGLPRRVRQANLAPQLRKPVVDPEPTTPARSPDQARSLMSALQLGTNRGRADAARTDPAADAATVSLPASAAPAVDGEKAPSGPEAGVNGDHADGPGENLMLEKDS